MRNLPKSYNGITILLDKPSRFDKDKLLTGHKSKDPERARLLTGQPDAWLDDEVLYPLKVKDCDVRTLDERAPWLPNTQLIACLGSAVADKYKLSQELHGYPGFINNIPAFAAFDPQDCCDIKSYETDDEDDEDYISEKDIKDAAPTRRSNRRFWTKWHFRKFLYSNIPNYPAIDIRYYPNLDEVSKLLYAANNEELYIDIETSRVHKCITCIGFSLSSIWPRIYVVPVYLYTGQLAYSNWEQFWLAFGCALENNLVVAHNGVGFDFPVLHGFYRFPLPERIYDTLLANHRCFPSVEKSLSHLISQWTWLPYHKDENTEIYNQKSQTQVWTYNAKDVYCLKLIKDAQLNYATTVPGLVDSINQANSAPPAYIENSFIGIPVDMAAMIETAQELSLAVEQFKLIASLLVGDTTFNPGSSKQCTKFLHTKLNYEVQARTGTGAPKLGKKQLYQLLVKYDNPLLKVILKYRKAAKDLSMLESPLWSTI